MVQGSNGSEVALTPAGGNRPEAKGTKSNQGAKAVAVVINGSKTTTGAVPQSNAPIVLHIGKRL